MDYEPLEGSRRCTADRILRATGAATCLSALAFLSVGFLGGTAPAWLEEMGPLALESDGAGSKRLTKEAAYAAVTSGDYHTHTTCDDVDYAYCGEATCRLNGDGYTASCGCKRERKTSGRIFLNANSAYLVYSGVVRKALYEYVVEGKKKKFSTTLCDAVANEELWSGAGFDARYGSFADPSGYDWDEHDIGCSTTGKYYLADCEGAPCVFEDFDDTYDAICTCPYVESFMNATVDTRKIRRSTAKNCREIASAHGSCAVQETLNSGELMADYDAMKTLHGYIADADFRTGGTECKTHSDDDDS